MTTRNRRRADLDLAEGRAQQALDQATRRFGGLTDTSVHISYITLLD